MLHQRGTLKRKRKKKRKSLVDGSKREGKTPWNTQLPVWKKEGGGGIFSTTGRGRSEMSAIFYTKCTGGGVLSCSESTPVLQGSHHILFTIVCGWRKKKKKRREQWRERKPAFVQATGKRACVYLCLPEKARFFSPHTNSWEHLLLFYATVAAYEWASRAGKQRHPGFSWWWELTSDWFPWILMWRIVCFIEEQKEARWLPFRIC